MPSASTITKPIVLSDGTPGGFQPGGSQWDDENGQPHRRYVKELARVGEFRRRSDGNTYQLDGALLSQMADSTRKWLANGNTTSLPAGHDTTGNPDRNRGQVTDVFVEGDALYGVIEAIGEDGIKAASRSHVSIFSEGPAVKDSQGREYPWAIQHVALTTDPVINQQQPFIPIAASNGTIEADILQPATEQKHMDLKQLQKRLGLDNELTEENAIEEIGKAFDTAKGEVPEATKTELSNVKSQLQEAQKGGDKTIQLSNNERAMGKRMVQQEAQRLVEQGKLTPAQRDKLVPELTATDEQIAFANDGSDCPALKLLKTFEDNSAIKLGEQTGHQVVELAHKPAGGGGEDKNAPSKEEIDARAKRAHGVTTDA